MAWKSGILHAATSSVTDAFNMTWSDCWAKGSWSTHWWAYGMTKCNASVTIRYEKKHRFWINGTTASVQRVRRSRPDLYARPRTHGRLWKKKCQARQRNAQDTPNRLHMISRRITPVKLCNTRAMQHAWLATHPDTVSKTMVPAFEDSYTCRMRDPFHTECAWCSYMVRDFFIFVHMTRRYEYQVGY